MNAAVSSSSRVALVTGAGKRLGREIALALAKDGWRVAIHYRSSESDAQKTVADCEALTGKCNAFAFKADLADEAQTRALATSVIEHFGQLDAVVNSASTFEHDEAASFSYAAMDKHLHSNTGAAIVLAQALHAHLSATEQSGVVVNMLDQKLWNQNPDFFSYTLSKAALEAANTMLALALAPKVRVVGVAPGLTLTSETLTGDKFETLHKLSPLGRSSTPADVVATVKFAIDNSSLTGTTIVVDGGQHLMKFERDFSLM